MSVLVEGINVIIRRETLQEKFPGGEDAYQQFCPNGTFCFDDHLTRVGFMNPTDVQKFIDLLTPLGLIWFDGEKFIDIAVVDQSVGLTAKCEWLEAGRFPEGFSGCWLAGTEDHFTSFPAGRTPEDIVNSNFTLMTEEEAKNYELVRHEESMTVLRNKQTGEIKYTTRIRDDKGRPREEWH